MKKQLVASLAAAMVLGIAGTSFAAANPFVDVPAKHWSYDAVTKLASAGIVDGYGDGTFKGDKTISRYEMAQIVAKAMAHSDKATAEQKASIDKLSVEFASELEGLNVRVTKLEKNSSTVKITGNARIRYNNWDNNNNTGSNDWKLRTRLNLSGNINDQWTYGGRLEATNDFRNVRDKNGERVNDQSVELNNAWVQGPVLGTTATFGRFDYMPHYGLVFDSTLNGANFAFGNAVKTNVFYGKEFNADLFKRTQTNELEVTGATFKYGVDKKTNLVGGYYQLRDTDKNPILGAGSSDKVKVWEVGADTKLNSNWALKGNFAKSDADDASKAYFAQVDYKGANVKKAGSFGAWVNYRHLQANALPRTTIAGAYALNKQTNGGKGYEVGFAYTPAANVLVKTLYADIKSTADDNVKSKFYRAQAEFFF
jgi:hypothetical protein